MILRIVKRVLQGVLALFALVYIAGAIMLAVKNDPVADLEGTAAEYSRIAIFGASGTAGDGILKAALKNTEIDNIQIFTRRMTHRIEEGVDLGKVVATIHMDYLDYSAIEDKIKDVQAVYWAIGTSAVGLDEETYRRIHVEFPLRFVESWLGVSDQPGQTFHYISSSDISEESRMMWAREKVRAENTLFAAAAETNLGVIAYRPDYIGPTEEEAHIGQDLLYWFFRPVGAAVRAEEIGNAMFEVTARGTQFKNGDKVGTRSILRYSDAFIRRSASAVN